MPIEIQCYYIFLSLKTVRRFAMLTKKKFVSEIIAQRTAQTKFVFDAKHIFIFDTPYANRVFGFNVYFDKSN